MHCMEQHTILIADDDEMFADMLSEILHEEGANVLVARNGQDALDMAKKEHPSLVMCDMMMPIKTGAQAIAELRTDEWGATVPAILLTNMSSAEVPMEELGGSEKTEILLKTDWTLEKLVEHIEGKLG
jgi:CheY-like chemotaxis protein